MTAFKAYFATILLSQKTIIYLRIKLQFKSTDTNEALALVLLFGYCSFDPRFVQNHLIKYFTSIKFTDSLIYEDGSTLVLNV